MNIDFYRNYISAQTLMGPSSVRILEELLRKYPLTLTAEDALLDLGCGKGLTSLVLARETPAKISAADLWILPEENDARFRSWGIRNRVTPIHEDANALDFAQMQFQALVSVDAYHYFGTGNDFFSEKILPFLAPGGQVLIGIPGIKPEYTGRSEELLAPWLGEDAYMFRSPAAWKTIIGDHHRIKTVETWEMDCFETAWSEWFATGHEFALGDHAVFEKLIRPYTCFVGICIKLK